MKDNVNHPSHYETGKFECIEVMLETQGKEAVKNFCICNAFKYIYRHNNKNGVEDIKKAKWYLDKYIEIDESEECKDPVKDCWENIQIYMNEGGVCAKPGTYCEISQLDAASLHPYLTDPSKEFPGYSFDKFRKPKSDYEGEVPITDLKKEDWVDYNVKVGRAMENAIKMAKSEMVNKNKLVVSNNVLEDIMKGARKCCEDILNGTIHADNETGYDKGVDLKKEDKDE